MISCKKCNSQELDGAIFCSQCGTQIINATDTTTIHPTGVIKPSGISDTTPQFPPPPPEFENSTVALCLIPTEEVIFLPNEKSFTIGRSTEGQLVVPDVDLAPFNAYEAGVSRLHTNLKLQEHRAVVKDLGSANGTRINGKRISAHAEHVLAHGDILTLGKLKLQILIKRTAE